MEGTHTNSFSILVPFSTINKKNNKTQNAPMQRTLSSIIAQNQIREQNLEYQHLLIRRKELQIEMEERKNELDFLVKKRKKADKVLEEAIGKRNQASLNCKQKRCYLDKYYQELDRKFRGGKEELFNNLAKLEQSLLQAYAQDQKKLKDSLVSDEQEFTRLVSLVGVQRQKRDYLRSELNKMQQSLQNQSFGVQRGAENSSSQLKNENNYLRMELQRLGKQKKKLESQQKILKRILNIEEQHKKHSNNIVNGIKKIFTIKLKEQRYRTAVSPDYQKNIQGLKDIIAKKKVQKAGLLQEINEKQDRLNSITRDVNEKNRQYGELEQRLIRKSSN